MSYYFDFVSISNIKNHRNNYKGKDFFFKNLKDSTYVLVIGIHDSVKKATLIDYKKRRIIKFDVNFDYQKIEDLNKLSNSKLHTGVAFNKWKKNNKLVEDIEFEKDTGTNKTIVHLTQFKNKKRKKIINEHYYYFGDDSEIGDVYKNSIKNYLIKKYNLTLIKDENLEKIIQIASKRPSRKKGSKWSW